MGFPASDFLGCAADSGLCIVFGAMSLWKRNVEWSFERSPMMLARAVLSLVNFTGFWEAVRLLKKLEKKWHCWSVGLTFKVLFICLLHYKWLLVSCSWKILNYFTFEVQEWVPVMLSNLYQNLAVIIFSVHFEATWALAFLGWNWVFRSCGERMLHYGA